MKDSFAGYRILGCQPFSLSSLTMSYQCLLASMFSNEKSDIFLIEASLLSDVLILSWCFQKSLFIFVFWQFCYNVPSGGSLNLFYLKFIECFECADKCFSSKMGNFQPLFLEIILCLFFSFLLDITYVYW